MGKSISVIWFLLDHMNVLAEYSFSFVLPISRYMRMIDVQESFPESIREETKKNFLTLLQFLPEKKLYSTLK